MLVEEVEEYTKLSNAKEWIGHDQPGVVLTSVLALMASLRELLEVVSHTETVWAICNWEDDNLDYKSRLYLNPYAKW